MGIKINNVSFNYNNLDIFTNLDLSIQKGKVTVILGPSGCGKTTLLNLISGVLQPTIGSVTIPKQWILSYLFQEPRLLPWKTVKENILFVLDSLESDIKMERCHHYLAELEMLKFQNYYPNQLSGGMKQRTAIARAFAYPSNTILMDEPFKGLDLGLKLNLIKLFNKVWREEERTALFVTHDIHEALMLGDEIIVLSKSPVKIRKQYTNPLPHLERSLKNPGLLSLERELITLLT